MVEEVMLNAEVEKPSKKLIVIDTMQYFEIEVPADVNPEEYLQTQECREICADKILSGMTDLSVEKTLTRFDFATGEWFDG